MTGLRFLSKCEKPRLGGFRSSCADSFSEDVVNDGNRLPIAFSKSNRKLEYLIILRDCNGTSIDIAAKRRKKHKNKNYRARKFNMLQ
jgi:hypothetical protein